MADRYEETAPTARLRAVGARPVAPSVLLVATVAVVLGVVLGACARLLPDTPLNPIIDTVAFWALCGFVAGAVAVRPAVAVLAAVVTEVVALTVWYAHDAASTSNFDWAASAPRALVWGFGALVAGAVFGLAGAWWRTRTPSPRAELAAALPVAVELWAAAYAFAVLHYTAEGLWALVIAGVLLVALPRTRRDRLRTAVTAIPITLLGLLAGVLFVTVVYRLV